MTTSPRGPDGRPLKVRVKKSRNRTTSSQKWLQRQLNDPYVARAQREGWRSRAAFKLIELDEKARLLKRGLRIVDLGAAPGGWSQVAAKKIGLEEGQGKIVAIDLLEIDPIPGVTFAQMDFLTPEAPGRLMEMLGGQATSSCRTWRPTPPATRRPTHLRIVGLVELAAEFARQVLAPGGAFLAKVIQGGTEGTLLGDLKRDFAQIRHIKPAASRADSAELYVLATGFRGQAGARDDDKRIIED